MKIRAILTAGHGVASGKGNDLRYPEGTIRKQLPYFMDKGLDLSHYFPGTLNLDIAPLHYTIGKPKIFIENIEWSPYIPPENFFFFDITLDYLKQRYQGLIYMPDPRTKTDHLQKPTVLEVLAPKIDELSYGDELWISVRNDQILVLKS